MTNRAIIADQINAPDGELIEVDNEHFKAWWSYFGLLHEITDEAVDDGRSMTTRVHGFETVTQSTRDFAEVDGEGSSYGFVSQGSVALWDRSAVDHPVVVRADEWFAIPGPLSLRLAPDTRVVVSQRVGYSSVRAFGGPIEAVGRLRYIDRCSDTVLAGPPHLGDPCLNHLHFPAGIEQTEHTHPSVRTGIVARGRGWCETPIGRSVLQPGLIFSIPTNGLHRFLTSYEELDVVAYHPDSDWGPTDEDHPMVNRTWVEGEKIDNASGVHLEAEVIGR